MFIKVNEYTINTDQITYILHDHRGDIKVYFSVDGQDLTLPADEAVDFLKKLYTLDFPG